MSRNVLVIESPPGIKDLSELHIDSPSGESFKLTFERLRSEARPLATIEQAGGLVTDADVTIKPTIWRWWGWLAAGKLNGIAGEGGTGKSTIILDLAARLSVPMEMPDGYLPAEPVRTLVLSAEAGTADDIVPLYQSLGGREGYLFVRESVVDPGGQPRPVILPDDLDVLENDICTNGIGLVIIDPLSSYLRVKNSWAEQDMRAALHPIAALADRTGVAILTVHHLNKDTSKAPVHRVTGSVAVVNTLRVLSYLHEDEKEEAVRHLISIKRNKGVHPASLKLELQSRPDPAIPNAQGPNETIGVPVWKGESPLDRHSWYQTGKGETKQESAEAFLMELLDSGPASAREVKRAAIERGIAETTLQRARKALEEAGLIETEMARDKKGQVTGSTWSLTDDDF